MKLRATDPEDLQILAAHLQDAIVPVSEMLFEPGERRFVLVANRFRWETAARAAAQPAASDGPDDAAFAPEARFERIHCGLRIEGVRSVRHRGFDRRDRGGLLELLTVGAGQPGGLDLVFAGGAAIRLEIDRIDCYLEDIGEAWPTQWRPRHEADEGAGA